MSELTPYLCVADARAAIAWYVDVLGAEVVYDPIEMPDGRIGHVELAVDGARWMMSDEFAEAGVAAPDPDRGSAVSLHLTVEDVDALADTLGCRRGEVRPRPGGQPTRWTGGGVPGPVRAPVVPQPADRVSGLRLS